MRIYNIINIPKGLSPEFECDCQDEYNSGYTQGVEDQKSKLSSLSVTGNGEYVSEDGFSAVTVDVPQEEIHLEPLGAMFSANGNYDIAVHSGYDGFRSPANIYVEVPQTGHTDEEMEEAFESGVTSGITEQKSRLSGVTITENGTYTRADGFSAVTVDVPQEVVHLENLTATLSANGRYDFTVHSGYDAFNSPARVYVEVPQTGHTDQEMEDSWNSGYTSGYTDGQASVDCTDFYNSGYTDGYESGYTDGSGDGFDSGYTSGVTDGYASGYTSGKTDGFDAGYDSGVTDGYTSGKTDAWQPAYDSGYTDGAASVDCQPLYDSGYTDGYSSGRTDGYDDGWRPGYASGYTSGKTDGFGEGYDSGFTDGVASVDCQPLYDSGYTDGYESGHTDGYDERAAMLTAMTITANGAYESVEGWSAVTVNVSGYSQEDLDNAYASGHTSGVTDGAAQQKALLSATAFTTNGTYTRTDGWSAVTVNVAQTGYTREDLDNAYTSGLTNGYDSGWTTGYDSGYTDGLDACGTDFNKEYLTIEALSVGTLYWGTNSSSEVRTIEWSKDEGRTWSSVTPVFMDSQNPSGTVVTTVNPGDKVLFKGDNYRYAPPLGGNGCSFKTDFEYVVYGNIMSLINSVDFPSGNVPLESEDVFANLFRDNTGLISAGNLKLPATAVYNAAEYYSMFRGCVNLRTAPDLTNAVRLDCTTMFSGCTSLTYVKCLALNPSTNHTTGWLKGVSASGTFVKHPDATWTRGADGIPEGWSIVDAEI